MARNTSVSLGDHFTTFIDEQVASGRYASASDVVRAGLRLLQDHEHQLAVLRLEIQKGVDDLEAGRSQVVDASYWDGLKERARSRQATGTAGRERVAS